MRTQPDFTDVVVIFNPNSTGSGEAMAQELKRSLSRYDVQLVKTKYAGHAEKLAYSYAKKSARPLIISASGDGGYHEVINGLIRAQQEGAKPTAGLLPAGNANDHHHDVRDIDIAEAIELGKTQRIDLLKLTSSVEGKPFTRYAHSYIGLGLTPKVGKELNKTDLNRFNEVWIVLKALFVLRPIRVIVDAKRQRYDSLIASNVKKMSKVLSLSKDAAHNDGKFEVTVFEHRNKFRLLQLLIQASTTGLSNATQHTTYEFQTITPTLVQLDGEIFKLDANATATIDIEHHVLTCIV